jgi:hypothetical protein
MKNASFLAVSAVTLCISAAAHSAVYNFFDTTFVNADWAGSIAADTSVPPSTFFAGQLNAGGSALLPGPQTPDYRIIRHTYGSPPNGAIVVSHEGVNYDWLPAPLEVATTVDYSYDLNFLDGPVGAIGFAPAIFQGGNVYRSAYDSIFGPQSGWVRFSGSGVPIASFLQVDPTTALTLPNSPNPALAMSFGFVSANSASGLATKTGGIDDFRITLNTVPEPASLAAIALVGTLGRRRRNA